MTDGIHYGYGRSMSSYMTYDDGRGWGTGTCDDFMFMSGEGYAIGQLDPTRAPEPHSAGTAPGGIMRRA